MKQDRIVLASNNPGKVKEINALLSSLDLEIIPQADLGVVDAVEDGLSFVENALIKARHAAEQTSLPAIADDSGLEVTALNGEPGIYSARYAGENASDEDNLTKLINQIQSVPVNKRQARFICVMVFLRYANDPVPVIAQGIWNGEIVTSPSGKNGFGYDPVFYLSDRACTSAELAADVKNSISHRGIALKEIIDKLKQVID
ncbi:MAG: RdgB/HAM1 family non-canonical purine NTP pyrophosphatase [Pseudomonadota bacterium]